MYLSNFPFLGDNKGTNNEMTRKEKTCFSLRNKACMVQKMARINTNLVCKGSEFCTYSIVFTVLSN